MIYDVIVIGGGASGMMAAIVAARSGAKILLIEKNTTLGNKLAITGGGRCNIYNAEEDTRILLSNYGKAEQYLYSAFHLFGVQQSADFFDEINTRTTVQAKKRAFPVSEKAEDVVKAMSTELQRLGVSILLGQKVDNINTSKDSVTGLIVGNKTYNAKSYILATGGFSRPETGSTGDGFRWLRNTGHSVNKPSPSITPLAVKERWISKASGVSIRPAGLIFRLDGVTKLKAKGDVLITHFGLSGPAILNSSTKVSDLLKNGDVTVEIDCLPNVSNEDLDKSTAELFHKHGTKLLRNVLSEIAPNGLHRLITVMLNKSVDLEQKAATVSRSDRQLIVSTIKHLTLNIDRLMGMDKAVVADGGINIDEVDMRTFRSNRLGNLYITGDLLDINRPSGGFSLQLCWTSGYIAGVNAAS
jgi:predicted Rossmann fold flavoprotein